jgi:hypothetical protein
MVFNTLKPSDEMYIRKKTIGNLPSLRKSKETLVIEMATKLEKQLWIWKSKAARIS